jgi:hypothetical protein
MVMVGDFVPGVERAERPDNRLGAVGEHGPVQLVHCLQGALVRHDRVPVHQRCVQQSHRIRLLLQNKIGLSYNHLRGATPKPKEGSVNHISIGNPLTAMSFWHTFVTSTPR